MAPLETAAYMSATTKAVPMIIVVAPILLPHFAVQRVRV